MKIRRVHCIWFGTVVGLFFLSCTPRGDYKTLIEQGQFKKASRIIVSELNSNPNLTESDRLNLQFELERMRRIRQDFTKNEKDILDYVKKYVPAVNKSDLRKWEASNALEALTIDGEKWYFNSAAPNLFRLEPTLKALKQRADSLELVASPREKFALDEHIQKIMTTAIRMGKRYVCPVNLKIKHSISVPANVVPAGKVIRCWIPFPRDIAGRQVAIKLLSTDPQRYIIADNEMTLQRTIYFEKVTVKDSVTNFLVEYSYQSYGVYVPIEADKVRPTPSRPDLQPFLSEQPPHIVFTPEIRELSRQIVDNETNPYRVAQKLFAWVDNNIPWASAREYSTFTNIPSYVLHNRHGDCGMQTLAFITLCRLNGIPARWQSGWEFQPPDDSMHDWGEIYFEPYGWVPMDVTYGQRTTTDEHLRWFYLNGMDSYRLIFNEGISDNFYPAKVHFRSETVDSQRGEVEWEGGNLYFDQWDWNLEWELISRQ